MKVAITGSSGLVGTALDAALRSAGHGVVRLVRRVPVARNEIRWDPVGGMVDREGLAGVDAVVNLAGAGIGDSRWTRGRKREIRDSRVLGTRTLVAALGTLDRPPAVLVSGSAIGYYGARGDTVLAEDAIGGEGFLADVVRAWEAEVWGAQEHGVRVVAARTGLVMAPHGGAFARLLPLLRRGLAGGLGDGRQWWSWITLVDEVRALQWLLETPVSGPVNLTAPQPLPQQEIVRVLARASGRSVAGRVPAFRVPAMALRGMLGEMSHDILASQRVVPTRLQESGFGYRHATIDRAAEWLLGDVDTAPANGAEPVPEVPSPGPEGSSPG